MRRYFAIATFGLIAQLCFSQSEYRFKHYSAKDGLADDFVFSIEQDSLGYIWAQYYGGLTRFDGNSFKVYKYEQDNPGRSALNFLLGRLTSDPNRNIWVSKQNHQESMEYSPVRFDVKSDSFIKYNTKIKAIISWTSFDHSPTLWLSSLFGKGLFSTNLGGKETHNYLNRKGNKEMQQRSNSIFCVERLDSSLLLATPSGLWNFDLMTKNFTRPTCAPKDSAFLYNSFFIFIFNKPKGNIWLLKSRSANGYSIGGLVKINSDFSVGSQKDFPLTLDFSSCDIDENGVFWIGTWGQGLYRFDPSDDSFVNIRNIPGDSYSLPNNSVNDVMVDRDQNIWVATSKGISKLQRRSMRFFNHAQPGAGIAFHKIKKEDYLIVRRDGTSLLFDRRSELLMAPIIPDHLDSLQFERMGTTVIKGSYNHFAMGKQRLWVGADIGGNGVHGFRIDPESQTIETDKPLIFAHDPNNPNTLMENGVAAIWEDRQQNVWIANKGLHEIVTTIPYGQKGSVRSYLHLETDSNSIASNTIFQIYPEEEKSIWVVTDQGVDLFHPETGAFEHIFKNRELPANIYKAADGTVYLGTLKGLYEGRKINGQYTFGPSPIWGKSEVLATQEDRQGRLWLYSRIGLVCYDRTEKVMIELNESDGITNTLSVQPGALHQTSGGIMVMTDENGLCLFDPVALQIDRKKAKPLVTNLEVNNRATAMWKNSAGADDVALGTYIAVMDDLVLDYRHNNFSLEFSAMEMISPEKNLYRYKLEGYDEDWIETDSKKRSATYTNLDAGNYVFKIKASNHHGIWSDQETILNVTILPSPWKTWWAYSVYLLALIGAVVLWRNYEVKRVKLKHRAEHLTEVDQLKSRFFANISHEFRTPITLVLGPLKGLHQQISNPEQKNVVGSVIRNGQRLQRLINQLLDLSKVEAGKMKLHTSQVDLVELLREIVSSYESLAKEKNIRYFFYPEVKELAMYVDEEKIEKIIYNLLSNAFKFTKEGGEIILHLRAVEKSVLISVSDSGIGIPEDQLDKIFDRFYQVDGSQTRTYEGSGLGLALVKDLVDLHHGRISVDSKEGSGTTFSVSLPLGKEHLQKEEIVDRQRFEKMEISSRDFISSNRGTIVATDVSNGNLITTENPVVLIVEDNADMRQYIRKILSTHYQIVEAENGREGLDKAKATMPDLIISDIMMPEMDGYKLCSMIKSKELTSHIPVILLTAKADRESKMSGLEVGADDYLSKPFDADELKLIVRNRIDERRKMREHFSKAITLEPKQVAITSLDEKFITKVLAIIESHMDDEEFSIEDFSQESGCSRMQFYRKIKGLTDQTPSQFVRSIRLKRAAQLLAAKSDNVSQIAYTVGFGSLAYFNKCFKEQFGVTPGQYAEVNESTANHKGQ